jgi:HPt (histidine-containing phosphotransfer) domain-containing protein
MKKQISSTSTLSKPKVKRPGVHYTEYATICSRIEEAIRMDQIEGGMVGQYNASITQRINALKEHTDVTSADEKIGAITVTIVK